MAKNCPPVVFENTPLFRQNIHNHNSNNNATHPLRAVELFGESVDGAKAATEVAKRAPMASENFIFPSKRLFQVNQNC
jgi:hypothetical protein